VNDCKKVVRVDGEVYLGLGYMIAIHRNFGGVIFLIQRPFFKKFLWVGIIQNSYANHSMQRALKGVTLSLKQSIDKQEHP
jgi:hypothetical protein